MENLIGICLGLGLAAACGFRVFVPFLVMSLAAHSGHLQLAQGFQWIGSTPALVSFATATLAEIAAYYVPWVDHFLDLVATPGAVVAGMVITASAVTGMSPWLHWGLAAIAGGGVAASTQLATAGARHISTWTTLGLGNPVVSTAEAAGSFSLSLLAVAMPLAAAALLLASVLLLGRLWWRRRRRTLQAA